MIHYTYIDGKPQPDLLINIEFLYTEIFGSIDQVKFKLRTNESQKMFTALAWHNNKIVGFKMGYAIDTTVFYSWIGGVKENYRKSGIANELMNRQHNWCRQNGFEIIRTKTMNRWKSMLILNLKNGFDIKSTYTDEKGEIKIIMEKSLI